MVTDITSFEEHSESYSGHALTCCLKGFGEVSFQEYVTRGISHPVFYGDLVDKKTKDGQNWSEFRLVGL